MSRANRVWRRRAVLGGLVAVFGLGCSPSSLWFLMRGDDKRQPEIPLPAKKDKDHVTVAILANGSPTLGIDFAGAERELATLVGKRMADETQKDEHPIRVVEASKVERLKHTPGRDWRTANPAALGKELGVDYVLDLTLNSMTMYQPEYGREFYQGRASLQVVVYDTEKPDAPIQDYVHNSMSPEKSTAAVTPAFYRKHFIDQVATEIAHRHIPHMAVRELPAMR